MKKLFTFFMFCCTAVIALAQQPFITKWYINDTNDLILPLSNEANNNFTYIVKKEGALNPLISETTSNNSTVITFPERGVYDISISSSEPFKLLIGNYRSDRYGLRLLEIMQWGDITWHNDLSFMFSYSNNMYITATDIPNFSNVNNMRGMFSYCNTIRQIPNIDLWNVSNVTDMGSMFQGSTYFNSNINNWNVSNVTDMSNMFSEANYFNQPLNNWNVSNVTDMSNMFDKTSNFNQPLNNWNVSNVTSMERMFYQSYNFNQPLDNWNVSSVTNMNRMFDQAFNFNQSLGNWQFGRIINLENFIDASGINCTNYSKSIQGWSLNNNNPRFLTLNSGSKGYSTLVVPMRQQLMNNFFWEFLDDYEDPNCEFTLATNEVVKNNTVLLSPNPVLSTFSLSSDKEVELVEIYNAAGQKLEGFKNTTTINVANYKPGMYIVKVTVKDGKVTSHKLIKK